MNLKGKYRISVCLGTACYVKGAGDLYDSLKETNKKYQMFYYLDHHWTSYGAYVAYTEFAKLNNLTSIKLSKFDIKEVSDNFNGTLYSKTNDYSRKPDLIHNHNSDRYALKSGQSMCHTFLLPLQDGLSPVLYLLLS